MNDRALEDCGGAGDHTPAPFCRFCAARLDEAWRATYRFYDGKPPAPKGEGEWRFHGHRSHEELLAEIGDEVCPFCVEQIEASLRRRNREDEPITQWHIIEFAADILVGRKRLNGTYGGKKVVRPLAPHRSWNPGKRGRP